MSLPIVMLPHSPARTMKWAEKYPGRIGMFCGLETALSIPEGIPYALDNGKFAVWSAGKEWDEKRFIKQLDKALTKPQPPKWVVVPDEVANPIQTLVEWMTWAPRIKRDYGFKLALAVQDGMNPKKLLFSGIEPSPDVIFVGGSAEWKWKNFHKWCLDYPRVHVGRVNSYRHLWMVERVGAESSDGTGWFRGNPETGEQVRQLRRYLDRSQAGLGETDTKGLIYDS